MSNRQTDRHLVSEDHESVVRLAPDDAAHALGRVPHGVERQEVVLPDLELVPKVLQTRLETERHRERDTQTEENRTRVREWYGQ